MKWAVRILPAVFAVLLYAGICCAAPTPVEVASIDSKIAISSEDRITVEERITAYVATDGTNKGLIRDIPIASRWQDKGRQNVELKVLEVLIDGTEHPTDDIEVSYGIMSIYMRDQEAYLSSGEHEFVLKYEMTQQIGYFDENDELTWNAVGPGWNGVKSASCIVLPPPGAEFEDCRAWIGKEGDQDSPVDVQEVEVDGQAGLLFEAQRPLDDNEIFTVAVAWPKGICAEPAAVLPEDQPWLVWGLAGLLAFVLAWTFGLWHKFGRDPKEGPVIPRFYPPYIPARLAQKGRAKEERLSAVAVNWLWNKNSLNGRGMAAFFITLGLKKLCALMGDEKSGYAVRKLADVKGLSKEENTAGSLLPPTLNLDKSESAGRRLYKLKEACEESLESQYGENAYWKLNILPIALSFLPSLAGLYAILEYDLGPVWPEPFTDFLFIGGFALCCAAVLYSCLRKLFLGMVHGVLGYLLFFGQILFFGFLGLLCICCLEDVSWVYTNVQLALMAVILLVPALYVPIMDAPTVEMSRLRNEIAGLAMYIGTAESQLLNFANPPDKTLAHYHSLLPYAVALGLEKAWGERFAAEIAAAGAALPEAFSSQGSIERIVRQTETCTTYAVCCHNSSGGSSFRGGGGGAGSGGGGGGGRAC